MQHSQKAPWSALRGKALVLVPCTGHENEGAPDYVERAWAYSEVEQWVENEVERELAEIDEWIA